MAKLGDFIVEITDKTTENNQYPVLTSSREGLVEQNQYFNKQVASKDNTGYKIIHRGQFTYRAMSDTGKFYINQLKCSDIGIVSPAYPVFEVKSDSGLCPEYLQEYFRTDLFQHAISLQSSGSTRVSLKLNKLKGIDIVIPSMERQNFIVNILAILGKVIENRRSQLCLLDELIKSRFIEKFGDYQETHKLSEVAIITGGLTKNAKRDKLELRKPYLRVANVSFASIDTTEMLDIGLTKEEYGKTLLQKDDLLFVEGNGSPDQIGRVAIWNGEIEDCVHQNHLIKARFDLKRMSPIFAMYYFISERGRSQIKKRAVSTSGLYTLSVSKIAGFEIPLPPLDLQNQFADFVTQVDKSKFMGCNRYRIIKQPL